MNLDVAVHPLSAREIDQIDGQAGIVERAGLWVPLLGWLAADAAWSRRTRPIRGALVEQLNGRPEGTLETWGDDPEFRGFAQAICEIARKEMGWPNARFIPEDPWRVVFWSYEDGLDAAQAILDIEHVVGFPVPDTQIERHLYGTLGEFVRELYVLMRLREE